MAVPRNRLDENKGIFGPFVAGQKDEALPVILYRKQEKLFNPV